MTTFTVILMAFATASVLLINICVVVACGQLHRICEAAMIKLTKTREITPYRWVHPDEG